MKGTGVIPIINTQNCFHHKNTNIVWNNSMTSYYLKTIPSIVWSRRTVWKFIFRELLTSIDYSLKPVWPINIHYCQDFVCIYLKNITPDFHIHINIVVNILKCLVVNFYLILIIRNRDMIRLWEIWNWCKSDREN